MLAGRAGEPIGQQGKEALGEGLTVAEGRAACVQYRAQRQLLEQVAGHPNRSPGGGLRCGNVLAANPRRRGRVGLQEAHQGVQMRGQEVLPSEMSDDALPDLGALPVGLHQAQVLVVAAGCLDRADEQKALRRHYK